MTDDEITDMLEGHVRTNRALGMSAPAPTALVWWALFEAVLKLWQRREK